MPRLHAKNNLKQNRAPMSGKKQAQERYGISDGNENFLWHLREHPAANKPLVHINVPGDDATPGGRELGSKPNVPGGEGQAQDPVRVAIIDSGIDPEHPNLVDAISFERSASFEARRLNNIGEASTTIAVSEIDNPYDAHGTALAGIVAGRPYASGGARHQEFRGVAPRAELVIVRLFVNYHSEAMLEALQHAYDNADIILIARTFPAVTTHSPLGSIERTLQSRVREFAQTKPIICAAGNDGNSHLAYPASLPETISVGACNEFGYRSRYSQYGAGLDLVAPSSDAELRVGDANLARVGPIRRNTDVKPPVQNEGILGVLGIATTDISGNFGYIQDDDANPDFIPATGDRLFGGTSAASAQVAGVVALMMEANSALIGNATRVREILHEASSHARLKLDGDPQDQTPDALEFHFGHGLIDTSKAVRIALEDAGSPTSGP